MTKVEKGESLFNEPVYRFTEEGRSTSFSFPVEKCRKIALGIEWGFPTFLEALRQAMILNGDLQASEIPQETEE